MIFTEEQLSCWYRSSSTYWQRQLPGLKEETAEAEDRCKLTAAIITNTISYAVENGFHIN